MPGRRLWLFAFEKAGAYKEGGKTPHIQGSQQVTMVCLTVQRHHLILFLVVQHPEGIVGFKFLIIFLFYRDQFVFIAVYGRQTGAS
jgi:hypothetical protein